MSSNTPVTLIPGDGIGPEIVEATLAVLDALEVSFDWDVQQAGLAGVKATGDTLPEAVLDSRSEEHPSELPSLMRISYAVFCLKKNNPYLTAPTGLLTSTTQTLTYSITTLTHPLNT